MVLRPILRTIQRKILRSIFAQPIPITQMDLISNLILQRGVGAATFTRSTIGTFEAISTGLITTAAIDEARFETNGVLNEGESTNALLRSEEAENVVYLNVRNTISVNAIAAPDGETTADGMVANTDTNNHRNQQEITVTAAQPITLSRFVKAGDKDFVYLVLEDSGVTPINIVFFNLSTGTIGTKGGNIDRASITALPNGWFRITASKDSAVGGVQIFQVGFTSADNNTIFTGDGSTIDGFIWGAFLPKLPFASSYIKTIASPVTRTSDNLSIDAANIPAPTENYTISVEVDILGLDSTKTQTVYSVDGETSRKIEINTTTGLVEATHGAVTSTSTTALTPGTKVKIAFTVGDTNQTLYIDGTQEDQDTKGTVTGTATAISIGNAAGLNQLFGKEKFFGIFKKELTPDEVANL